MKTTPQFLSGIAQRRVTVGIVGVGHIGAPLVMAALAADFTVIACDIDRTMLTRLEQNAKSEAGLGTTTIDLRNLQLTQNHEMLSTADVIAICVPTPLTPQHLPDLQPLERAMDDLMPHVRPGMLIVLESTSYPGTTNDYVAAPLTGRGFAIGVDVFVAHVPSREDPGNEKHSISNTPRVVGAADPDSRARAMALYDVLCGGTVPVSSWEIAESAKLLENSYRAVNIALVNEFKLALARMSIDIREVLAAAATKPFGFAPFLPGPGFGGHCIPIDPVYMWWKARESGYDCALIEASMQSNGKVKAFVVESVVRQLQKQHGGGRPRKVLIAGVAYKENIDDVRASPAFDIAELLKSFGCEVYYHDPLVKVLHEPESRSFADATSNNLALAKEREFDVCLIVTAHSCINWKDITRVSAVIVDTRNKLTADDCAGRVLVSS